MSVDSTSTRFSPESDRDDQTPILPALVAVVLLCAAVFIASCYDQPEPDSPTEVRTNAALVPQGFNFSSLGGIEAVFGDIATRVPGFAGFHGSDRRIIISLTDPSHSDAARNVVGEIRGGRYRLAPGGVERDMTVRSVEHTFFELAQWRNRARALLGEPYLLGLDLDEESNVVRAIVPSAGNVEAARQALIELGLPEDAVTVSVEDPITLSRGGGGGLLFQSDSTLRDNVRPTRCC